MKLHFNQSQGKSTKGNKIKRESTTATTASWDIIQHWSVLQSLFDVILALSLSSETDLPPTSSAGRHSPEVSFAWMQRWATTIQRLPSNAEDFTIPQPPSPPSPSSPRDQSRPTHHFIINLLFWFQTSKLHIQFLINIRVQRLFSLFQIPPTFNISSYHYLALQHPTPSPFQTNQLAAEPTSSTAPVTC